MIGTQDENEPAVLTIVERKTRFAIWMKVKDHTALSVQEALGEVF